MCPGLGPGPPRQPAAAHPGNKLRALDARGSLGRLLSRMLLSERRLTTAASSTPTAWGSSVQASSAANPRARRSAEDAQLPAGKSELLLR